MNVTPMSKRDIKFEYLVLRNF